MPVVQAFCEKSYTHNLVYLKTGAVGPEGAKLFKIYKSRVVRKVLYSEKTLLPAH